MGFVVSDALCRFWLLDREERHIDMQCNRCEACAEDADERYQVSCYGLGIRMPWIKRPRRQPKGCAQ